jgi:hypothetical protein
VGLVRHGDAVALLPGGEPVDRLDMALVRRIAAEASAAGISPYVERVRDLASSLAGVGAAT